MKRIPLPPRVSLLAALSLAVSVLAPASRAADTISVPRGTLTADRDLIRVGSKPTLTWNVEFPSEISTLIDIIPPNTIQPKKDMTMKVRVLGASFQETVNSYLKVEASYRINNSSSWTTIFSGIQTQVKPANVLLTKAVVKNCRIDFGGRGNRDGGWLTRYNTAVNTPNIVMLQNGDSVPSTTPAFQQGQIESFLSPYIDSATKRIKIGPRDLILLYELGQTDPRVSGFDLQDLVVLVTLE